MQWRLFYFIAFGLVVSGCSPEDAPAAAPAPIATWFPLRIDTVDLEAQIALTQSEQVKGLMHRESLPADGGMLFPYQQGHIMTFWMANTPLPLDIGFFDQHGVLLEIHRMYPFDTNKIRSKSDQIQFALEMHQGWFNSKGLRPGAKLDLELVGQALKQRGADPARYGLGGN